MCIRTLDAFTRANLVLPLSGHDLGVDARDLDASIQASLVVGLDNITAVDLCGANAALVWPLGAREAVLGPSIGMLVLAEDGVFLLEAEPELVLGVLLHQPRGIVTEVEGVGLSVRIPRLAHDEDVGLEADGVGEDGDGADVDVRVLAGGLAGGGAVEIPFWKIVNAGWHALEGLDEDEDVSMFRSLQSAKVRNAFIAP